MCFDLVRWYNHLGRYLGRLKESMLNNAVDWTRRSTAWSTRLTEYYYDTKEERASSDMMCLYCKVYSS